MESNDRSAEKEEQSPSDRSDRYWHHYSTAESMVLPYVAACVGLDSLLSSERQIRGCFFERFGKMHLFFVEKSDPEHVAALTLNSHGAWSACDIAVVIHGLLTGELPLTEVEDQSPYATYLAEHPHQVMDRVVRRFFNIDTSVPSDLLAKGAPFAWPSTHAIPNSLKVGVGVLGTSSTYMRLGSVSRDISQSTMRAPERPAMSESEDPDKGSPELLGFLSMPEGHVRYYRSELPLVVAYDFHANDSDQIRFETEDINNFIGMSPENNEYLESVREHMRTLQLDVASEFTFLDGTRICCDPKWPATVELVQGLDEVPRGLLKPGDGFATIVINL
ncbi:MAG: hypothetical protein ACYCU8_12460 [Ferrimicrobium acidiphilum]